MQNWSKKRSISACNGQKYKKISSVCKILQNHNFSCGPAICDNHACEALVTPSVTARSARKKYYYVASICLNPSTDIDIAKSNLFKIFVFTYDDRRWKYLFSCWVNFNYLIVALLVLHIFNMLCWFPYHIKEHVISLQ